MIAEDDVVDPNRYVLSLPGGWSLRGVKGPLMDGACELTSPDGRKALYGSFSQEIFARDCFRAMLTAHVDMVDRQDEDGAVGRLPTVTQFIGHLIDNHEGERLTEEALQAWLAETIRRAA